MFANGSLANSAPIRPSNIFHYRNVVIFPFISLIIMLFFFLLSALRPKKSIIGSIEPKIETSQMVNSILFSQVGKREVVEVPRPTPILGGDGKPVYAGGLPVFNIQNRNADYVYGETSSVSREFTRKYICADATRAKLIQLAVFFALAETAEWGECMVVVGDNHHPIMTSDVKAQAVMKTHGNRSSTQTIEQLAQKVKASYGAVQKALAFWEGEEIMWRIQPYEQKSVIEEHHKLGRKIEFRRYEFDPFYVWNGPLWLRTAYGDIH